MQAVQLTDPGEFLELVEPMLLATEARHNLIIGVAHTLVTAPDVYPTYGLWVVVDAAGYPQGAALMTVPYNLVLAEPRDGRALQHVVDAVRSTTLPVPGVVGTEPHAGRFAEIWTAKTGRATRRSMAQGIFALESVEPVSTAPGRSRPATKADHQLVADWYLAFTREASPEPEINEERVRAAADRNIRGAAGAGVWLWEVDGKPVCLSGYGGPTPNGIRIGPVYTPPEHRRRGFATALVAEQSQWLLDQGRSFCFLYTDLANPTSNAIYRRIGYRQVAESAEYRFAP